MIDNIKIIENLLNFENEGDFYMLYIMKRKKDQKEEERENHQSVRTIKTYCIESMSYLNKRYEEIKQLCEIFKARAYIHVQKQNHKDISLQMMSDLALRIQSNNFRQEHLFNSTVGSIKTLEKRWIVDIDVKSDELLNKVINKIEQARPENTSKLEAIIPTRNGYHLITKRFDVNELRKSFPDIDIQKKNPTLLYYPNSLELVERLDSKYITFMSGNIGI